MTALVIEDEPLVVCVFRAVLELHGLIVITAQTAKVALRYWSNPGFPVDLVIVDRLLPDASGTEVALNIVPLRPEVQFLFTSGSPIEYWDAADLHNLAALPNDSWGFLQKPFTAQKLMAVVGQLMYRRPAIAKAAM